MRKGGKSGGGERISRRKRGIRRREMIRRKK